MDAPEDRDVKLHKASAWLLETYSTLAPSLIRTKSGELRALASPTTTKRLITLLEPFQESPQLLDPHLPSFTTLLTQGLVEYIRNISTLSTAQPKSGTGQLKLPVAIAKVLYTLIKIRGYKIISRFLPNEPFLLERVSALFSRTHDIGIDDSWELRYVLLLWLSHLLLAPFDLSTISENSDANADERRTAIDGTNLDIPALPSLCKRLLALGVEYLSSPGNRENDAAALLLIRISLRKDMREMGLLDAMVNWGLSVARETNDDASWHIFLKTGVLAVLAGFLAQGESEAVRDHVPPIYALVQQLQDVDDGEGEEWKSAGIRRLGMKIYRWVASLSLRSRDEETEGVVEDVIERLLNSLGDRDTAVRFGASKSLAVVARKLDPDMAGDVLEAVMGIYEEDVLLEPAIPKPGQKQRKIFSAVSPERWHGATLTLATFLRQRAVRTTEVLEHVLGCIVEALSFEQRRATFAVGGNVRDAACYAAWSLARNYTTAELLAAGEIVVPTTAFDVPRTVPQILATELTVAGCLDPLGNVRRASSAALQELIGRHPNCVKEGIPLVQAVDYSAVALRRRSVVEVSKHAAVLGSEYWHGITFGIIESWRGVGASDDDGRKLAAAGLNGLINIRYDSESTESWSLRIREVLEALTNRILTEGSKHIEIYHGGLWALSELLDGVRESSSPTTVLTPQHQRALCSDVFARLTGAEFVNPILRSDLVAECTSRLVNSLCRFSQSFPSVLPVTTPFLRRVTAIIEASLQLTKDGYTEQAISATNPLFSVLSNENKSALIAAWTSRVLDPGNYLRGPVLALAEVAEYAAHKPEDLAHIVAAIVSAATRAGEVEMRVAGVKALTRGIIAKGLVPMDRVLMTTIGNALDDYAVDMRGDVGSWVRAEAVAAVVAMHQASNMNPSPSSSEDSSNATKKDGTSSTASTTPAVPISSPFTPHLARLSLEKLDRLRLTAASALLLPASQFTSISSSSTSTLPPIASRAFFHHLLSYLLPHPLLRIPALTGIATSAGTGSDSVMKSSRQALIGYFADADWKQRRELAEAIVEGFKAAVAAGAAGQEGERVVTGWLGMLAAVVDAGVIGVRVLCGDAGGAEEEAKALKQLRSLFIATQKAHYKSGSIPKLEAAVCIYGSLAIDLLPPPLPPSTSSSNPPPTASRQPLLKEVLKKLASLMLHPYLRIRVSAAEMMFLVVVELEEVEESAVVGLGAELGKVDWSKGVKDRRVVGAVGKVKKALDKL